MIDPRTALEILTKNMSDLRSKELKRLAPGDRARYAQAREAFITAGARAVMGLDAFDRSLQIDVETTTVDRLLTGTLGARAREWRRQKRFDDFFFMRKPPGLRLRFFGRKLDAFEKPLLAFLESERKRGAMVAYAPGIYDAETYQFGGLEGLALMHAHATYDSLWALEVLRRFKGSTENLPVLSLLGLNDLLRNVVGDSFEAWDVWENMRLAGRVIDDDIDAKQLESIRRDAVDQQPLLLATWESPETVIAKLKSRERALMRSYFAANASWARKYRAVAKGGSLLFGMRKILPFYVIFHWNRLGLPWDLQCVLTYYMRHALNPKRGAAPNESSRESPD